ncbi:restriction endonuclease subunit S [Lacticaseibacillus rhamnosus]|uniref:restriction endonuclease subunit S n=1 Tax=Lacticaseibacillus rhamnosus TaxID=47715 RepID=UPI001CDB0BF4|nr:restriction endonuclease subunit S [Lacticaseibacillus rhamnosus]
MNAWEKRKLGEIADIRGGGTPSTSKPEYWDGEIDWYAPAEIGTQRYVSGSRRQITNLGLNKSSATMLPANKTILFTSRAGIGNAAILTKSGATNQGFQSIVVKPATDIYFLYSEVPEIKRKAIRLAAGSTFLEISGKSLSKIQIWLPSFKEQSRIGHLFLQIDNLIAATQQKISDLEDIKVSTLRNLFNQTWRIRHYSDDWKNIKLSDISTKVVEKNVNYQYKEVLTNSAEFGIVNQQDYFDKSIANPKSLSDYYVIHPNDFVYNPRISRLAPVGPVRRNKTGRIGVMSPLYYVFKIDGVDPTFLEYFFKNNGWHRFMYANGDTGARADRFAIKDKVFEQMPIQLPSKDEQEALGTSLKALERLIAEFLKRLDNLKKLKEYLLSSVFA